MFDARDSVHRQHTLLQRALGTPSILSPAKKTPERVENVIIKKLLCCVFAAVKGRKLKPRRMWFIQVTVLTVKTNVSFVFAGYSSHRVTSLILTERIHPYQSVLWWELELLRASLLQFSNPRIIGLLLTN